MTTNDEHYLKKELYALLQKDAKIFDFIESGSLDGVWYWDVTQQEHEWMSPGFWQTLGYTPEEKKHSPTEWQDLIHPDDLQMAVDNFHKHCADPSYEYSQVVRYRHKEGHTVWVRCRGIAIRDDDGNAIRMLGAHNDITALKQIEEDLKKANAELKALAQHDTVTGLLNRAAFDKHFQYTAALAKRLAITVSLLFIDLDQFKNINDKHTHMVGDEMLKKVGEVLKDNVRKPDTVCRYGGDEFIVILMETAVEGGQIVAEELKHKIAQLKSPEPLTASIGVSTSTTDLLLNHDEAEIKNVLIKQADRALFQAKKDGPSKIVHFEDI